MTLAILIYLFGVICAWLRIYVEDDSPGWAAAGILAVAWPLLVGFVLMGYLLGDRR